MSQQMFLELWEGDVMLKLFGMFFLFLILFFVVFALCIVYRLRTTLRSLLKSRDMQEDMYGMTRTHSNREPEGMVIDVEAEKR